MHTHTHMPSIPTTLLQCVPPYRRGAIMGLDSSVNTVARILAPIALGTLYQVLWRRLHVHTVCICICSVGLLYKVHGAAACFYTAGVIVLLAAATAGVRRLLVIRQAELA